MLFRRMPEPDITPKATRRRVVIVLSLVVLAAGLGLVVQKISMSKIESLGWEQCYVKQTSWRFGKEIFSSHCESHGLMKLDPALDKLSLEALKDKLNKEMFEQE